MKKIAVSVGVMAHNEEQNISSMLQALLGQDSQTVVITEIIVVSSGSTDKTNQIVEDMSRQEPQIKLICQPQRLGKASAVNTFLLHAQENILVLESADTIPLPHAIEKLVAPFADSTVGMTGGQVIPTNDQRSMMGFGSCFMWHCHHLRNVDNPKHPKLGEFVAFRRVLSAIDPFTVVDEAEIEAVMHRIGRRCVYSSAAVVRNSGPETWREFILQRRRNHFGHLDLWRRTGYRPLVGNRLKMFYWGLRECRGSASRFLWLLCVAGLEAWSVLAAYVSILLSHPVPYKWTMIQSARRPDLAPHIPEYRSEEAAEA